MIRYLIFTLLCSLALTEVFFILNTKYRFIKNPEPQFQLSSDYLSREQALSKYGTELFSFPKKSEFIFYEKLRKISDPKIDPNTTAALTSALFGTKKPSTVKVQARLLPPDNDIIIYDVEYKLDQNLRRLVENQDTKLKTKKFILALGDSLTFGEGVTTGDDYPSQLAKKIGPDFKIYNFGSPGSGPNDLLFRLQNGTETLNEVTEDEGIAIWLFIENHFERFSCGFLCYQKTYNIFVKYKPDYELIDNRLVLRGNFSENMNLGKNLIYLLAQSEALRYFNVHRFFKYSHQELSALAAGFKEIRTLLQQKKNLKKFYVLIPYSFNQKDQLVGILKKENIDVIDLSDIPLNQFKDMILPVDRHPTAKFNWIISEALKKFIEP